MLDRLRSLLESHLGGASERADPAARQAAYQLAAAALLVEMTRADFEVHPKERVAVVAALRTAFDLSEAEAASLMAEAEAEADGATSLYEFTALINEHLTPPQKYRLVELLWRVAYADGEIDKYEDHLVRKVADLIYVRHREFIRAKHDAASWRRSRDGSSVL